MQINKIENSNTSFGANVASNFIRVAQNNYNYNNVPNKKKLIWQFNKKVEEYSNFGHDEYTIDYEKKLENGHWEHYLIANKNDGKGKVVIFHRSTLKKIIERFMQMNKHEFNTKFSKK